ncbi:MAG: cell division protein ZapA [Thermoanaerobacterium sp.]|nr:cell division protein ZapA [Thermoanaerobacterium sp.]
MEIRKITVNINGNEYILKTDYPEDYILKLTEHLNGVISGISDSYNRLSNQMVLVLSALNIADELFISREENSALKKEIVSLKSRLNADDERIEELTEEVERLKEELKSAREELEEYINTFDDVG